MYEAVDEIESPETIEERKLPWVIDMFLFPVSASGLTFCGMVVFVPLVIKLIAVGLDSMGPLLFPVMVVMVILLLLVRVIIVAYIFWYFAECVRESGTGETRATMAFGSGDKDDVSEMMGQMLRIVCGVFVCLVPSLVYYYYLNEETVDNVFWVLLGVGVFFFPMTLLSVLMFDSIRGLNPIVIIVSIFKTFFRYIPVALAFYVLTGCVIVTIWILPKHIISGIVARSVTVYLLLVIGHILGRFYYINEERLYWDT